MLVDGALVHPLIDLSRHVDREISDMIVRSLLSRMRQALLDGQTLQAPGIGEISVRQGRPHVLVNPVNGEERAMAGERTLQFRPDRKLLRELNAGEDRDSHAL